MKRFYKITAIIAAVVIGIGSIISIVALCVGGTWVEAKGIIRKENRWSYNNYDFWGEEAEFSDNYSKAVNGKIKELNWDIAYGNVIVMQGDEFSISTSHIYEPSYESYVENEIWYINYKGKYHDKSLWNFITDYDEWNEYQDAEIIITIPRKAIFKKAKIIMGAGELELNDITVKDLTLDVGAGSLNGTNVSVTEKGELTVGVGEMILDSFTGTNLKLDCGIGSMDIEGEITGDNTAHCGMGELLLNLSGRETDYNYKVSSGIGEIEIGDYSSFSGIGNKEIKNEGAKYSFNLDCGVGSIELYFD